MTDQQLDFFDPRTRAWRIVSCNEADQHKEIGEDCLLVDQPRGLVGVFDGVGSRGNGFLASQMGAQILHSCWKDLYASQYSAGTTELEGLLQHLIQQMDQQIASIEMPTGQKRPATTVALAVLVPRDDGGVCMTYAHVGDSRIYLLREGQMLQRLTEDDGYFSFAAQKGWLSQEESQRIEQAIEETDLSESDLEHFEKRNKITCAVGWADFQCVHTNSLDLRDGDRIVFCTDGIHDNLTDQEIEDEVRHGVFITSAQRLVESAYQRAQQGRIRSKQDDISAIVLQYVKREELPLYL